MVLGSIRRHYFATKILAFGRREAAKKNKIFETLVMCWVGVKTQLPEEGATVDCWVVNARAPNGKRSTDVYFAEGRFYGIHTPWVTHWRYPPAPPSGIKKSELACKGK